MTWKEDAVSREAPASLEAPFIADGSTFSKFTCSHLKPFKKNLARNIARNVVRSVARNV